MRGKIAVNVVALAGFLLAFGAGEARAGGKTTAKTPSAAKILQESFKNLAKAKSYRAKLSVVGGVTESKIHQVTAKTVNDSYTGAIFSTSFGSIMEVANPQAFRTRTNGAIRKGGSWKSLVAARDGARMDRLFVWPQVVMQRALKYKKSAKWVDTRKKKTKKSSRTRKSSKKGKGGRTAVAEKERTKGTTTNAAYFPGTIRVEAPTKEALKHIIEVENSGCLSGG